MATNKDDIDDAASTENAPERATAATDTADDDGHDEDDAGRGLLPISRRDAILTGVGIGGLGFFGSQSASAKHHHPLTEWHRHQSAQGKYSLIELAGLNMAVMPHGQELEDFEGSGLAIEDEGGRTKLTVNFDEADLDRRYLSWNNDEKALDFTGAAEWENEVDEFSASGSPNAATGTASVAVGGAGNTATGDYAVTPGGQDNEATGAHSFAAGAGATASDDGSFVWATGDDSSRGEDSVHFQASGGASVAGGDLDIEDGSIETETDLTARHGDVSADDGNVVADATVRARHGHVEADDGNVIAEEDVIARTGDVKSTDGHVIAHENVESTFGNITAVTGNVEGEAVIANDAVQTDEIVSRNDLTLDPTGEVISEDDLEVRGNLHVTGTKHFSTAVETPSGPKQVTYTSVEAGKPRTEASDVAELTDGRAEIDLPPHFAMVTSDEEPLAVQVTPYATEQVHPQVVEQSLDRIVVEDMGAGPDEYTLAYTVKGVRKGFEDTPTVREP